MSTMYAARPCTIMTRGAYSSRGSTAVQYGLIATIAAMFISGGIMTVQPHIENPFAAVSAAIAHATACNDAAK
jgi:Flp pilus assembly pilin Flp